MDGALVVMRSNFVNKDIPCASLIQLFIKHNSSKKPCSDFLEYQFPFTSVIIEVLESHHVV